MLLCGTDKLRKTKLLNSVEVLPLTAKRTHNSVVSFLMLQ